MKIDIGLSGKGSKPLSATTQLVNSAINAEKIKKEVGFENYYVMKHDMELYNYLLKVIDTIS